MSGWQSTTSPLANERTLVGRALFLYFLFKNLDSAEPTTRSVIGTLMPAARANLRSTAALGAPATARCTDTLLCGRVFFRVLVVGIDDARDQRVAHDVDGGELAEGDAAHLREDAARFDEAALLPAREVDLR